ncbi:hypothetical protein [Bacillus smithii]|uniref:hypothetical protein n=1 Tax=Bacillus smithii TaxID=1479 RepID=UPI003D1D2E76
MPAYINHITLNTGHTRKTYAEEVDKELYFILKRILKDSFQPEGAKLFDSYTLKGTSFEDGAIFTLYKDGKLPILTTAATKKRNKELWGTLHETATIPLYTKKEFEPAAPYIADRVEIGTVMDLEVTKWTGDMAKCLGWIVLFPGKIR